MILICNMCARMYAAPRRLAGLFLAVYELEALPAAAEMISKNSRI